MSCVCVNVIDLKKVCAEYISLVVSGVNSLARVEKHELLSELTGIPYEELRTYLWNLDRYGYTPDLESADWDYVRTKILQIADELVNDILSRVEERLIDELRNDESARQDLLKNGYTIEDWVVEWKENGYWLCGGEPTLNPVNVGDG